MVGRWVLAETAAAVATLVRAELATEKLNVRGAAKQQQTNARAKIILLTINLQKTATGKAEKISETYGISPPRPHGSRGPVSQSSRQVFLEDSTIV
jgi:hypothetical protein